MNNYRLTIRTPTATITRNVFAYSFGDAAGMITPQTGEVVSVEYLTDIGTRRGPRSRGTLGTPHTETLPMNPEPF